MQGKPPSFSKNLSLTHQRSSIPVGRDINWALVLNKRPPQHYYNTKEKTIHLTDMVFVLLFIALKKAHNNMGF